MPLWKTSPATQVLEFSKGGCGDGNVKGDSGFSVGGAEDLWMGAWENGIGTYARKSGLALAALVNLRSFQCNHGDS